jgi:hypothetical protein
MFVIRNHSSWLSPKVRQFVARAILFLGALGPGLALLINPARWGQSAVFLQLAHLPVPLQFFGISLVLACALILIPKLRDVGYVWVAMFYFTMNISGFVSILNGQGSALIFALPVLLWIYLEAAITATRDEAKVPTAYTDLTERG